MTLKIQRCTRFGQIKAGLSPSRFNSLNEEGKTPLRSIASRLNPNRFHPGKLVSTLFVFSTPYFAHTLNVSANGDNTNPLNKGQTYSIDLSQKDKKPKKANEKIWSYEKELDIANGFLEREEIIKRAIKDLNRNILPALKEFNRENNISLECLGIMGKLIFVNTFKGADKDPVLITLWDKDIEGANSKAKVKKLFKEKLVKEKETLNEQHEIWNNSRSLEYDLPKNGETSLMLVTIPRHLRGIYTDFSRMAEIYNDVFQSKFEAICVDNKDNWSKEIDSKGFKDKMPEATIGTKAEILTRLESSLKNAIDGNKKAFVLHYLMHGSPFSTIGTADDQDITMEELAAILSMPHNGRPISAQIDLTIIAETCFGGFQLIDLIKVLDNSKIGVKNLRIIVASDSLQFADAVTRSQLASLFSDKMKGDESGTFAYYFSYYFELLEYLKQKGTIFEKPVGTLTHAIQFADRMARADSIFEQDLQALYYSYDPATNTKVGKMFSKLPPLRLDS